MEFKEFIAEIKTDFNRDFESGLIDEGSVRLWVSSGLKRFGENIMTKQDTVVHVRNGKAELPEHFHSLYFAVKCEPSCRSIEDAEAEMLDFDSWVERTERGTQWNSCDPTCKTEHETVITEKLFVKGVAVNYNYTNPTELKLGKGMKRSACSSGCLNRFRSQAEDEIHISNNIMYTNFTEGEVYLIYYGLELDEEGDMIIPDTDLGKLEEYLEYRVKRRIFENKLANDDDKQAGNMLTYYMQQENNLLGEALTAIKFQTLTPASFTRLKRLNRSYMEVYEAMFPKI